MEVIVGGGVEARQRVLHQVGVVAGGRSRGQLDHDLPVGVGRGGPRGELRGQPDVAAQQAESGLRFEAALGYRLVAVAEEGDKSRQ